MYSKPHGNHPHRESIHLTTEAFNTFKNSISKIATCLRETDRGGQAEKKKKVSEQETQLLIYVQQWMKASEASVGERTALKLKSISSLDCRACSCCTLHFPSRQTPQHMKKRGETRLDLCPLAKYSIYLALIASLI